MKIAWHRLGSTDSEPAEHSPWHGSVLGAQAMAGLSLHRDNASPKGKKNLFGFAGSFVIPLQGRRARDVLALGGRDERH